MPSPYRVSYILRSAYLVEDEVATCLALKSAVDHDEAITMLIFVDKLAGLLGRLPCSD